MAVAVPSPPSARGGHAWSLVALAATVIVLAVIGPATAEDEVAAKPEPPEEEAVESHVSLPTDRLKERQLDRARRLIADERWSDAATLLDDMLVGDRDFFFQPHDGKATWRSIKTEASRLLGSLPAGGRTAYELQFRARADRLLNEAIAGGDSAGIIAIARRWFHTPAGRRATLLAAIEALDADQPLAAAAWLERLAAEGDTSFEPTLSVMRAVAWWRSGDRRTAVAVLDKAPARGGTTVRLGGRDVSLAFPGGDAAAWLAAVAGPGLPAADRRDAEWWMARGDASRNARVEASRPLLVPRYKVPLTRHPDEARLLEKRRRAFADRDSPLLPAGVPLAVGGSLLARSPLGLLAVDFATGKRMWLRGGPVEIGMADEGDGDLGDGGTAPDGGDRVFGDSTSGVMSSNGRLVYAIEPDGRDRPAARLRGVPGSNAEAGNVLAAYDLAARGGLAWRRPASTPGQDGAAVWHLGAPLAIGDQLFVLAEEKGEIRLDVLSANDGRLLWSQPLAELDEEQLADRPETRLRRFSGLSPTFAEGVLVCPTGAGTVIAMDLATRTLLWAYTYAVSSAADDASRGAGRGPLGGLIRRGVIVNGVPVADQLPRPGGWRDACPITAGGRVLLTPAESEALHCLDLRTGSPRWTVPRGDSLYVAGIVDGRAVVVGSHSVDSLALEDGTTTWQKPVSLGPAAVSGRGVLTPRRLFVPLDTPEVVEIDLADGSIAGRSPARGNAIPGNLLAYRGEIVSQGIDSLDVFHQIAPLEGRIETANRARPADPWVLLWRGQLDLDRGAIAAGLRSISAARQSDAGRVPADVVAEALLFGMRRDFAAAAPLWREITEAAGSLPRSRALLCVALDNQLASGAVDEAWRTARALLELAPAREGDDDWLVEDLSDPALFVAEPRWLQGRIRDLLTRASPSLRREIDAFVATAFAEGRQPTATDTVESLGPLLTRFASHPAAAAARAELLAALDTRLAGRGGTRDGSAAVTVKRDLLAIELRGAAAGDVVSGPLRPSISDGSWPLGRVTPHRNARAKPEDAMRQSRTIPIPVDIRSRSSVPGLRVGYDMQNQTLVLTDGIGHQIGDPIQFDAVRQAGAHPLFQPLNAEAAALGPLLVVRSGGVFAAFAVRGTGAASAERLWMAGDASHPAAELPAIGFNLGRGAVRLKRNGNVPLGMRVTEPDVPAATQPVRGMVLLAGGVALLTDQTLEVRDPVTGGVAWRRHRLPASGELIGDDEFLCICPRDGRQATIVATSDGRIVRTCSLPPQDLRLATSGRRVVALVPPGPAGTTKLEWIDPATDERRHIGDFSGAARAVQAGPDLLAVLDPSGALLVFDLARGEVRFRATLPDMPAGLEYVQVIPWSDRLLVVAGRHETPQEQKTNERLGRVMPLPQMPGDDGHGMMFTGSIWALTKDRGEPLWPVPATVVRHCLHRHQPAELPVLVFARQIQSPDGNATRLSLLALDKRTGHAVFADDRLPLQPHVFSSCDVSGDPDLHTVTLERAGTDASEIRLQFTGEPMAPRPPYQAATRPTGGDFFSELRFRIQKVITIPLPF